MSDEAWRPHPGAQTEFCSRGEFEVLYGGRAGPGKTDCLIAEATRYIYHPKYHGLILRRTFPRLQEIVDRCHSLYEPLGGTWFAGKHRWEWPNGAKVTLGHMQHEEDKRNYHGKEFQYIGWDELTEFLLSQYLFLFSRARSTVPEIPCRIRAATNPGGIGHVWVKQRFIDIYRRDVDWGRPYIDPDTGLSRNFIPGSLEDNPTLSENDPEYEARLDALPEVEKKRLKFGIWDAFEGQVFPELSQRVHGCDPFDIPPEWEKFMAFDWGYARPFCALWFAVDFDGVIYLYREFYGMKDGDPNKGLRLANSEICKQILELEREKISYRVADPSCWAKTRKHGSAEVTGPPFVEDAANEGLYFIKADNNRITGKQQVHERFLLDEIIDEETGEVKEENPRFLASKACVRWWAEMQELVEDPKNPEDVETKGQPDEGYDCTRYGFMSRPIIPKSKPTIPRGTFRAERARYIKAKEYARRHGVSMQAAYSRVR